MPEQGEGISQPAELLPEQDKKYLKQGLSVLSDYLLQSTTLPKAFIFPDVSARPLFYAVKPAITRIYESKNENLPYFAFMNTPSRRAIAWEDDIAAAANGINRYESIEGEEKATERQELARKKLEEIVSAREIMLHRAEDIQKRCHLEGGDDIMVIDDYVTDAATTVQEIRRAFTNAQHSDKKPQSPQLSVSWLRKRFTRTSQRSHSQVKVSAFAFLCEDEDATANSEVLVGSIHQSKHAFDSVGFTYRPFQEEAIGVIEDHTNMYVLRSPSADRDAMTTFRKGMTEIGERFVREHLNKLLN